jgi:hypothetical protein
MTWKSPLNPISDPYTGGNIDPVAKPLILTPAKPTTLIFQAPLNVLTYLPLQPFASWKSSCCYSVSQHLSLGQILSSSLRPLDHLVDHLLIAVLVLFYVFVLHYVNVPMYQLCVL